MGIPHIRWLGRSRPVSPLLKFLHSLVLYISHLLLNFDLKTFSFCRFFTSSERAFQSSMTLSPKLCSLRSVLAGFFVRFHCTDTHSETKKNFHFISNWPFVWMLHWRFCKNGQTFSKIGLTFLMNWPGSNFGALQHWERGGGGLGAQSAKLGEWVRAWEQGPLFPPLLSPPATISPRCDHPPSRGVWAGHVSPLFLRTKKWKTARFVILQHLPPSLSRARFTYAS